MLTVLAILGGVCVYLQIGRFLNGRVWEVWHKKHGSAEFLLFFPCSSMDFGERPFIDKSVSKGTYVLTTSLLWPTRLVWPFVAWPFMGTLILLVSGGEKIGDLVRNNKVLRSCFGKVERTLLFLGRPFYKFGRALYLALLEPENVFKGIGSGAKSIGKWFADSKTTAALPEKAVEDALPPMREELNGLLAEKEVIDNKIIEAQERICAEEARRMGTYREAPKLTR